MRRADRARKLVIEDEKFDDVIRRDRAMALTAHFQGARRSPRHGPLNFVERRSHVGDRRQQNVRFDVKQARSFVRALD